MFIIGYNPGWRSLGVWRYIAFTLRFDFFQLFTAWCWLSGEGGWLRTSGSCVWAPLAAELTPDGVDSACHPSEVSEMSTSVRVEGHSISSTAKLPYARTEQLFSASARTHTHLWLLMWQVNQTGTPTTTPTRTPTGTPTGTQTGNPTKIPNRNPNAFPISAP